MKKLVTHALTLIAMVLAGPAFSKCLFAGKPPSATYHVRIPASLVVKRVPIGGVLASYYQKIGNLEGVICIPGDVIVTTMSNGLEPSAIPNVYKTGVQGVGIRFWASRSWTGNSTTATYQFPSQLILNSSNDSPFLPTFINVEFVRTEIAVGSGPVPANFTAKVIPPMEDGVSPNTISYVSTGSTILENNFFFSSCESQEPTKTVPMGKVAISNIRFGAALEQRYALEVRCRGMRPATPAPMKIYFQGSTNASGMLNLTGAGQNGVAKGVAIEVRNDKGAKLPFNKSEAIKVDWQRSEADAEIYSFSGSARYAASGGEIKAGKADAAMTYILDYN